MTTWMLVITLLGANAQSTSLAGFDQVECQSLAARIDDGQVFANCIPPNATPRPQAGSK
jgi:hypothetical protein